MGAGIWAGFAGSVKDYVDNNRKYMQDKTERLENLILISGTKAVSSAKGKITDALTYKDALLKRGLSAYAVNGIFDEAGLAGLKQTYNTLEDRDDLLPKQVKKMSNYYDAKFKELYADTNISESFITDRLNSDFGLATNSGDGDSVVTQSSLLGSMFGYDNSSYNDLLNSVSPTTGVTGQQTLAAIGYMGDQNRGKGRAIDFSLLPFEPLPLSMHDDDLGPLNSVINESLRVRVEEYNNIKRMKIGDPEEYARLKRNYVAYNDSLGENKFATTTNDIYADWMSQQITIIGGIRQQTEVTGKIIDYMRTGIDAKQDILNVFKNFDANGYAEGYRDRVMGNIHLPTEVKNFYQRYLDSPDGQTYLNSLGLNE